LAEPEAESQGRWGGHEPRSNIVLILGLALAVVMIVVVLVAVVVAVVQLTE
jgi:hypothetical protein